MENNKLLESEDIDILFNFLFINNYSIQESFNKVNFKTKITRNFLTYIKYN
jgi:hypothetical protein